MSHNSNLHTIPASISPSKFDTYRASHPVSALPTSIFENHPNERTQYDKLKQTLLHQLRPEGELEIQTFERYVYALFMASRVRSLEIDAMDRWTNEPNNPMWFHQMEHLTRLAMAQERRADLALKEFRRQQMDRFASLDVANELFSFEQFIPIPAALPIAEMRSKDLGNTPPSLIAAQIMTNHPKSLAVIRGEIAM